MGYIVFLLPLALALVGIGAFWWARKQSNPAQPDEQESPDQSARGGGGGPVPKK
jgi:nitrogen fixation-related uncharacterized protein